MRKLYHFEVKEAAQRFLACENLVDLRNIGIDTAKIKLLAINPPYYAFDIKKNNGQYRHIEAPEPHLKELQRQLNFYLQCIYFELQPSASFGYIIRVKDQNPWKNILQNAKAHLGTKYMLNVDFKDFFHQFSERRIQYLLQNAPFQFDKKTALVLAKFFTYNGRLPMGAPTSPALSNLGVIALDNALTAWASENELVYTRFVDDLTFSSPKSPITGALHDQIVDICESHQLFLNPNKTKFFGEFDTKKVTGLVINDTIDIDPAYYQELAHDLVRLRHLTEVSLLMDNHNKNELLRKFKQEVDGKVNFIGMIEGYNSPTFYEYRQKIKKALNPNLDALSSRWNNFNYF